MSAGPRCWKSQPQIKQYARASALVTLPAGGGYFVDLFDVRGGKQHDYGFHGQVTEMGEGFSLEGAKQRPIDNVWTLAGLSGHAGATFDARGRSWGERVLPGNRIRKLGIPGEKVGYFGWYPPPKNGYGFIYDIKAGPAARRVRADWVTHPANDIHLRLDLFPGPNSTMITGKGPDLTGQKVVPFVIARRNGEGLASSFLALMEGYSGNPQVRSIEKAPAMNGMRGLVVRAGDGIADRIWVDTRGRSAFVRAKEANVAEVSLYQTAEVKHAGVGLRLASPTLEREITSVDYDSHRFTTDIKAGSPSALRGKTLFVSSPDYSQNSAYRIESCDRAGTFSFGLVGFDLAMADYTRKEKNGRIVSSTPMTLARTSGKPRETGVLDGKLAITADGARRGLIQTFHDQTRFRFKPNASIKKDDGFIIYDVKQGDRVTIPMAAHMRRQTDGTWELFSTCDVVVFLRTARLSYQDASGVWVPMARSQGGFLAPMSRTTNGRALLRIALQGFDDPLK